ncbi:molybdenum ABC transporter ATP-binding protein [Lentibacter algarum]|uniref:molybdenum ABC transporter ATP-binding protein n=1 Tax=Lentibacter algarum TaxID=576131 RepID=UPI001C07C3F7|nr:molybdenum ABC transporter ATP-binding protein [Lentibacter algarum]MBU2981009.1 molybdenum ABC transporter ATP-binding protein [Lentibacter algarum]
MNLSVSITKQFQGFTLNSTLELPDGITVLFGASGSGKSTLLGAIAGLVTPDAGRIQLGERVVFDSQAKVNVPTHKRGLGYMFQDARLFPHLSVEKNLNYGSYFAVNKPSEAEKRQVIEMLGIGHLLKRRPVKLSGGEKQRVALGRALLSKPDMLLADEPLAALDAARKAELLPYFERLRDEKSLPVVYVTHSVSEAARLANTVVSMGDGRILGQGSAAEVLADPALVPDGVRGVASLLQAVVSKHSDDGLSELDAGGQVLILPQVNQPVGSQLRVRVAAQDVILSKTRPEGLSALNIVESQVVSLRQGGGPGAIVTLETAAGELHARITRRSLERLDLQVGQSCFAVIKTVSIAREDIG